MTIHTLGPSFDSSVTRVLVSTPFESMLELVPIGSNAAPRPVSSAIATATTFHRKPVDSADRW